MPDQPSLIDDPARIDALMRYRNLDYSGDSEFQTIVRLAAEICEKPFGVITFVDVNDVDLRITCGLGDDAAIVPTDIAFCSKTILQSDLYEIEDTKLDSQFYNNPLVINDPKIRSYAGVPLITPDGYAIGTMCVMGQEPIALTPIQKVSLQKLGEIAIKLFESKYEEDFRKKTNENQLKEREVRYSSLVNNAILCIHEINLNKELIHMNPAGLEMMCVKGEREIQGLPYLDIISVKERDRIDELLLTAYNGQKSTFEFSGINGETYASCFIPIFDENNDVIKVMGISENITERKNNEKILAKEKERLELVMQATNDAIWDFDLSTNKVWCNKTYVDLFGRPPEINSWDWWIDRIHPKDRDRVHKSLAVILETTLDRWDAEYRFRKPDGAYAYILDHAHIARDSSGKATSIIGAMRDVSDLKKAEQNLLETNMALTYSMPGIARLDPKGYYTYVNDIYAGILGYTAEELTSQSWEITVDPKDIVKGKQGYQRMLKENKVEFDIRGKRKDGSLMYKHVLIAKSVNNNGEFIGHLCFMKDTTKQMLAEKQQKRLHSLLEHYSRRSNMSEMATSIAHELNQPLTAISHYYDAARSILKNEPMNDKLLEIIEATSEQIHRAGEIIKRCRKMARKQPIEKTKSQLNTIVKETIHFMESDIRDKFVKVELNLEKNLPVAEFDKVQIQQVLVNLIINGLDAMENIETDKRILEVHSCLNTTSFKKPFIQITVKDTGLGIANKIMNNLFDSFSSTKTDGMGMGLSISQTIIDSHNGKIWAENSQNKGAKFHFIIPITSN